MTSNDQLRLVELLCARLCHDLAGPVGAASAGAELFEDLDGAVDAETLGLVAASAAGAAARLKFFRAAFGPPAGGPQPTAGLRDLTDAYLKTSVSAASPGIVLDWASTASALGGEAARLALNLVLIAKDAMPRGGRLTVTGSDAGLSVVARGEPLALTDEARDVLIDGKDAAGPRGAQARFTRMLGEAGGTPVRAAYTPDGLALTAGIETHRSEGGILPPDG